VKVLEFRCEGLDRIVSFPHHDHLSRNDDRAEARV
jgi:hypothetical protein